MGLSLLLLTVLHESPPSLLPHFLDGDIRVFGVRKKLDFGYLEKTKEKTAEIHVKR